MYIVWDRIIQIEYLLFSCVRKVPSIDSTCSPHTGGYRGLIFFSLVLILHISAYLGIKGGRFCSDFRIFLAVVSRTNWCTIICMTCPILH
jgi:hypothetical protein